MGGEPPGPFRNVPAMAFRTWAKLLGTALGVAALAGASQLGVAYGLGILRLTRVLDTATRDQWTAQLAWVAWLAMMAAVAGALAGGRALDRWRAPAGTATVIGLAVAAGVGAAVVVPLTMQPARTAQIAGVHPVFVIGLSAGLGALAGAFAAYATLTQLVARWSLVLVGAAIWLIALISVMPSLAPDDPLPAVRLGVFDAGFLSPAVTQRTALFTMPALALLAGATLGWVARRREMPTLTIALAGLPGPALLTLAYLIAGPGSGTERYQVVPYWAAMTATGAGVLGSVLAAVVRRGDLDEPAAGDAAEERTPDDVPTAPLPVAGPEPDRGTARVPDQRSPEAPAAEPAPRDRPAVDGPPAGRRSSAADAFTSRTAEWALRRGAEAPAGTPPQTGIALGDYTRGEPEPFDAFRKPPPANRPPVAGPAESRPYVPAPAIPPMPPEAIQEPPSRGGGLRNRMPFGRNRGRAARETPPAGPAWPVSGAADPPPAEPTWPGREPLRGNASVPVRPAGPVPLRDAPPGRGPLVPEPEAISAPLPQPEPVTPPLPVTPVPDDTRRGRDRRRPEEEIVDWVSGLGGREPEG
jgi:hypothetical protein